MYVTWKITKYPFNGSGWDSGVDVDRFYDPMIQVSSGDAKDSFSFKLDNFNSDFSNYFLPNDKVTISRVINSTSLSASDVLMVGAVQNTPEQESYNQALIRVEGVNWSEQLLSGIVFFNPNGATIPNAIQAALSAISNYNSIFAATWSSTNPDLTSTNGSFPVVDERWYNKPIKDFITKYSTNDATGDGNYFWYVNNSNELIWDRKSNASVGSFNSSSDDFISMRINKDLKDVKNWVIVRGGIDPNGSPIQLRVQDSTSVVKNGLRPYVITIKVPAETLVKQDKAQFNVTDMASASYPLTPTWTTSSVSSYTNYVSALTTYVLSQCSLEGNAFMQGRKYGKLKLDLAFQAGRKSWGRGDLIVCTVTSLGGAKSLRVSDIQYTSEVDTFTLVEDIGTVGYIA